MIRDHYRALKQRILSEVPGLAFVDWFMAQYEPNEKGETWVWKTPAVYVEMLPLTWETLGSRVQRARLAFDVHLVNDSLFENDSKIVDTAAVDHFDICSDLFKCLHAFRCNLSFLPDYAGLSGTNNDAVLLESIVRTGMATRHDLSILLVTVQSFECMVYDYTATPTWATVTAALNQTVEIVDSL